MKKIKIASLLFSFFLFFVTISANTFATDDIKWHKYDEAKKLCNNNQEKLFIYFYSDSCRYCREMENKTFKDKTVTDILNNNFIPVKINGDNERNLTFTYKVRGWPGLLFVDDKEEVIFKHLGYIPPEMFKSILKYVYTDSYKTMSIKSYMESISSSEK
ncbi:MAG: thioredoxin fold domain-containing protein [Proteobacteria bacterium]|nr:thioredoxin fold domain-containing protein [Pseudomonadota bacterium]